MLLVPVLGFGQIKMRTLSFKNSEKLLHPGNEAKWMKRRTKAREKCGEGKSTRFSDSWILVRGGGRQKRVIENELSVCQLGVKDRGTNSDEKVGMGAATKNKRFSLCPD